MASEGRQLKAVRLDSGDMISLSRRVRQILDEAGFERVKIFASGSFDEYKIDRFQSDLNRLPKPYRSLVSPEPFPVDLSPALEALQKQTIDRVRQRELNGTGSMEQ
jgi:hypothetical protein